VVTSLYAALLGLLLVALSLRVIGLRRANRVSLGDGDLPALRDAIRAQGNASEYIPLSLVLLLVLELGGAPAVLIHTAGTALLAGRLLHAAGLLRQQFRYRVLGMQFTLFTLIGLAAINLGYFGYSRLIGN
jgi:uncharacterized membrane protein YecN with MAPEG domain